MGISPYDPLYRSGFDSYPEDYDEKGNLTANGRAAREYTDRYHEETNPIRRAEAYARTLESDKKCVAPDRIIPAAPSAPAPVLTATPRPQSAKGNYMTPEFRTYDFKKPLGGKDSGEVIHLREDTVAVDLGETIVKVSKAKFWDHVRGEVEPLVLGKEYVLNALLGGTAFWTPIWEGPSWEGPEIVIQNRDKNLKRILLEEFWEYAGFEVKKTRGEPFNQMDFRHFLFGEKLEGFYTFKSSKTYLETEAPDQISLYYARDNTAIKVGLNRFTQAILTNTRLPVPSDEVLDLWVEYYLETPCGYPDRRRDLATNLYKKGSEAVVFGAGFVIAQSHYPAFVARLGQQKAKSLEKTLPYDSSDDRYSGPAYDSNHYESPGQNPGSNGSHGIPGDMTR